MNKIVIIILLSLGLYSCIDESNAIIIDMNNKNTKKIQSEYYKENLNRTTHFDSIDFKWSANDLLSNNYTLEPTGDYSESILFTPYKPGEYNISLNIIHKWSGEVLDNVSYVIFSKNSHFEENVLANEMTTNIKKNTSSNASPAITPKPDNSKTRAEFTKEDYINNLKATFGTNWESYFSEDWGPDSNEKKDLKKQSAPKKTIKKPKKKIKDKEPKDILYYFVQISAWEKEKDAIIEFEKLENTGYSPYIEKFKLKDTIWWRVRLAPFMNRNEAQKISDNLFKDFKKKAWIGVIEKKKLEVENLIDYEDLEKKKLEVENLIDYEDLDEQTKKKLIEVENLIDYENLEKSKVENKKSEQYYIQISTWGSKERAEKDKKRIESLNYSPFILEIEDRNKKIWYKIRIGPISSQQEAIDLKYQLSNDLGKEVWIDKK